jgi:hypothetical protein
LHVGYRAGKEEELQRETPLLIELAEKATERHKDVIEAKKKEFMEMVHDYEAKEKEKEK